jgi:protein AbiQ
MLKFYDVNEDYVKYLQKHDKQIPNIKYESNNKFVCGVVLNICNVNYFAPISSNKIIQKTNLPIYDSKNNILATIKFSFMFPAFSDVIIEKDFKTISSTNQQYADLLAKEYSYCDKNENLILNKAIKIYRIGCNKNHYLNYTCCDFVLLENAMREYRENNT